MVRLLDHSRDATAADVDGALARPPMERTLADFAALLSPQGSDRLEELAAASRRLTLSRFGRTMHLYAPLYLSNECLTTCVYCGFARELPIARKTLSPQETLEEARHLVGEGFRSVLLLTGEHERLTGVEFLEERLRLLAPEVPSLSIEVQVWSEGEYRRLADAYFQLEEYQEFCASLPHLDDLLLEYVSGPEFDDLLVRTVVSTFPAHEHEHFTAHYRRLLGSWVSDQQAATV